MIALLYRAGGRPIRAEGVSVLAALGALDARIVERCGVSLGEDRSFDVLECVSDLSGARDGTTYRRADVSSPESNFTVTLLRGGAR